MKGYYFLILAALAVSCSGTGNDDGAPGINRSADPDAPDGAEPTPSTSPAQLFSFTKAYRYPGDTLFIFDHLTGDISEWWDHSYSGDPYRMYIEPRPGGGFYEIFDASGDGVLHATVIGAKRGKMLRMDGPLGLAGMAIDLVITYQLEPIGSDSTKLTLQVNAAGEVAEGIPEIVERVWDHFLDEQFKPYIEKQWHE